MGQEKDILTLSVSSNPSVLKGKAFVVYDVTTGDAAAYNAEKLANIEYKDLSMYTIFGGSLLQRETANCYVVSKAGAYMIPLAYGNGIKNGVQNTPAFTNNGGTYQTNFVNHLGNAITNGYIEKNAGIAIASAEIVWQDHQNLINLVDIYEGGDCKYLRFEVPTIPAVGSANAILAIKDGSGNIIWSWHIWVYADDLNPVTFTNYSGVLYDLLPVNLGWKWDDAGRTHGKSVFYQHGRKDPMPCPAAYNSNSNITLYGAKSYSAVAAQSIAESIKQPNKFFMNYDTVNYNWYPGSTTWYNLWDANCNAAGASDNHATQIKTVYDPCPTGFRIPCGRVFTGFTTSGGNVGSGAPTGCEIIGSWANGWRFKKNSADTVGQFFAASGYRGYGSGALYNVGSGGYCWSSAAASQSYAYRLSFGSGSVYPLDNDRRSYGFSVRPVRE